MFETRCDILDHGASLARRERSAMPESTENLIEHLALTRAAVDRVEQRLDDMTIRMGHLETSFAHEQSIRFDSVEERLARIEKRLELADA
jgi:hypothetical protein